MTFRYYNLLSFYNSLTHDDDLAANLNNNSLKKMNPFKYLDSFLTKIIEADNIKHARALFIFF